MKSTKFQKWQLSGKFDHVNKVSDVFSLRTGKEAMKTLRAVTFRATQELMNIRSSDDPQSFWYAGIKKVEQSGLNLPIFDNVVKLSIYDCFENIKFRLFSEEKNRYIRLDEVSKKSD